MATFNLLGLELILVNSDLSRCAYITAHEPRKTTSRKDAGHSSAKSSRENCQILHEVAYLAGRTAPSRILANSLNYSLSERERIDCAPRFCTLRSFIRHFVGILNRLKEHELKQRWLDKPPWFTVHSGPTTDSTICAGCFCELCWFWPTTTETELEERRPNLASCLATSRKSRPKRLKNWFIRCYPFSDSHSRRRCSNCHLRFRFANQLLT